MAMGPRWGVELVAACLPRCSAACRSAAGRPSTEPPVLRRIELFSAACLLRRSAACLPMSAPSPRCGFCCATKSLLPPALHPSGLDREVSLDMSNGLVNKELMINFGNAEELLQRIKSETLNMKALITNFEATYKKHVRPTLASVCILAPGPINDPWMVFLHRQTFKIANVNPSYLSSFDIMSFKKGYKDFQWERLVKDLVKRRIYVIDDWEYSFSTIEMLMYDHGLKQPDDGTNIPFYKGECDALYDEHTKTANLSYMVCDDNKKVKYSEVFLGVKCSSATEAEIFAALGLLYKAKELNYQKLLLWCDSNTVIKILNGELAISKNHKHRDLYLMLRSSRILFDWLVLSWKPRELMVFVDDLAKTVKAPDSLAPKKLAVEQWAEHLQGLPVFRIEWMKETKTAIKKFGAPRLMTSKFCTVAGDPLGTKTNREVSLDMSNGLVNKELMINFGNGEELLQRIKYETSNMKAPSPCSGFCYARKSLLPPALHPSDAPRLMISKFCTVARDPLGTKTGYSFETQVKGEYQSSGPLFHQHTDHAVLLVLDLKSLSLSLSMQMVVLLCTLVSWVILI